MPLLLKYSSFLSSFEGISSSNPKTVLEDDDKEDDEKEDEDDDEKGRRGEDSIGDTLASVYLTSLFTEEETGAGGEKEEEEVESTLFTACLFLFIRETGFLML